MQTKYLQIEVLQNMVPRSNVTVFLTIVKHKMWWNRQRKAEMKRV
jgi:hypothetical protein